MNEAERLAEVAALHHERKRKAEELAAIDRQIDLILFPQSAGGRKQSARSGKDWERILRCGDECSQKSRRALAG